MQQDPTPSSPPPSEPLSPSPLDDSRTLKNHLPFIFTRIVPAIAVGIFFWIGFIIFTFKQSSDTPIFTLESWQDADAPFGLEVTADTPDGEKKITQRFDPRFQFHSPWERAMIPDMLYTQMPTGSESGALTYNAQLFNELNQERQGKHSGDDLNGIGGRNSDLGDPVFAIANGLVVYAGNPSPGWGNCIILAHRTPDGEIIHTLYAHLLAMHVAYHDTIARGTQIGSVGKADVDYLAHLHLEVRESDGISPFHSGYPKLTQHDRLNPQQWISQYSQNPLAANLSPSFLSILQKNKILPDLIWGDPKDALKYLYWLNKNNKHPEEIETP